MTPAAGTGGLSRRRLLCALGAGTATAAGAALAGCQGLPVGPGANAAYYHATGAPLDADYDAVMAAGREAGYTIDAPYYVGAKTPRGLQPTDIPELGAQLGPDYRVFGVTFFHTPQVFVELWFAGDGASTAVSVFDDSSVGGPFAITSLPPDDWLVPRLTLAFEMGADRAQTYVERLKTEIADDADSPSVAVAEPPTFARTYGRLTDDATATNGTETHGDGWYELTVSHDDTRVAAIDFVVQSLKVIHDRGDHAYTVKLDRLGGFSLTIELPANEEIPEAEYRGVFRELFADVGLPPAVIDDLTFEYTPTIW